ncbi:MAG: guanosine monophosphate reductase [Gammaproteobacteria bacterium]
MTIEAFTYDDILLMPSYNHWESRRVVDLSITDQSGKLQLDLPIMSANMDTITESAMANFMAQKGGIGVLHRFMSIDQNVAEFKACHTPVFVSIGCGKPGLERAQALAEAGADKFCVDVAHAHARYIGQILKNLRASCGADIIKVGIGGGSVCTTRLKTGFGVPNLTAIKECSRVDRSIVADGGIRYPGDIVKALAFGADFVMIGSLLAGTTPTPGPVITKTQADGTVQHLKIYRGMASSEAADDYHGGLTEWKTAEGVSTEIPFREDEDAILADIIGGLRSGLTYGGAASIKALQRKLDYVRVTPAGRTERPASAKACALR